jgi:transposase InsO family protein
VACFSPGRSPTSHGLAESFSRTVKRDHVRVNALLDTATVLRELDGRFEDDNENHPHGRLGMRSPRAFIRATAPTAARPV